MKEGMLVTFEVVVIRSPLQHKQLSCGDKSETQADWLGSSLDSVWKVSLAAGAKNALL